MFEPYGVALRSRLNLAKRADRLSRKLSPPLKSASANRYTAGIFLFRLAVLRGHPPPPPDYLQSDGFCGAVGVDALTMVVIRDSDS